MTRLIQKVIHCPCGNSKVLALGLCSTCYTLKRQDDEYFGGLREKRLLLNVSNLTVEKHPLHVLVDEDLFRSEVHHLVRIAKGLLHFVRVHADHNGFAFYN